MKEINNSSDRTSKIIRVIDEIAFQTSLLALNAAIGAPRPEAGAELAAVADEAEAQNLCALVKRTRKQMGGNADAPSMQPLAERQDAAPRG